MPQREKVSKLQKVLKKSQSKKHSSKRYRKSRRKNVNNKNVTKKIIQLKCLEETKCLEEKKLKMSQRNKTLQIKIKTWMWNESSRRKNEGNIDEIYTIKFSIYENKFYASIHKNAKLCFCFHLRKEW